MPKMSSPSRPLTRSMRRSLGKPETVVEVPDTPTTGNAAGAVRGRSKGPGNQDAGRELQYEEEHVTSNAKAETRPPPPPALIEAMTSAFRGRKACGYQPLNVSEDVELHGMDCHYRILCNRAAQSMLKDEDVLKEFIGHFAPKSPRTRPNYDEIYKKCEDTFAADGLVATYLRAQREMLDDYLKETLRQCQCSTAMVLTPDTEEAPDFAPSTSSLTKKAKMLEEEYNELKAKINGKTVIKEQTEDAKKDSEKKNKGEEPGSETSEVAEAVNSILGLMGTDCNKPVKTTTAPEEENMDCSQPEEQESSSTIDLKTVLSCPEL